MMSYFHPTIDRQTPNTMKIFSFLPIAALFVLMNVPNVASAQVLIPDTNMRGALNYAITGIVNVNGIMDTLHPGIAGLDVFMAPNIALESLDLTGIEYLDSLNDLIITLGSMASGFELTWTTWPPNLKTLFLDAACTSITLPQLPEKLTALNFSNSGCPSGTPTFSITNIPDTVENLRLSGDLIVEWAGTGYINEIDIELSENSTSFVIPPIQAGSIYLNANTSDGVVDLSAVDCPSVLYSNGVAGTDMTWPLNMMDLSVTYVSYGSLGTMPPTLQSLMIESSMVCVPFLPDGVNYLHLGTYIGCIPNWPASLLSCFAHGGSQTQETVTYCSVLNSECPGIYPGITGHVFMDTDADGQYDGDEPALPQVMINIQPGGQTIGSNHDGYWEGGVQPGNYTIIPSSNYPYIQSISPTQHTADVPNLGDSDTGNDFAVTLIPDIQDLRVTLYADPARPGFDNRLHLSCQNYGTVAVDAELTLNFDGDQTWVGSSVTPTTTAGNTATWNLGSMAIGTTTHFTVDVNTAASVALGTDISHTLTADPAATDETPLDNISTFTATVVGSYDPNDKSASPNMLAPAQVQAGETPIEYTIRFQNTGTYSAERVVILDTLSEDLQWESMRFIASSHPNHWYVTDGVLHVIHNDILLPDSTSDEPGSHGFIKFSMLPATDLQDGATISNIAHIVFDFNQPIITPPAVFSVDVEAGVLPHVTEQMHVYPNPATDLLRVEFPTGTFQNTTYVVRDVLGQEVIGGRLNGSKQVMISDLEDGSYTIELVGKETRSVARFVKQ